MIKQITNLIKIAKQKLESKERELQRNIVAISRKNESIDSINALIISVQMPSTGSFSLYQAKREAINAHLYEIEVIREQIATLRQEQEIIKNEIKLANLEHEKMKYLYEKIRNEMLLEQGKIESKGLDEITMMLHNRKGHKGS